MSIEIYVPRDSSALSLGAESVAQAIAKEAQARGLDLKIIRNGSRGMYWLEPLVEVVTPNGRLAYGPIEPADVKGRFDANFHTGGKHAKALGVTSELPFLKSQQRLTFERVGVIDPVSVADYVAHGGYQGLKQSLTMSQAQVVQAITDSGLRGRGGAAFPTGIKWKTVLDQQTAQKYVTCNADEGDSGTFAGRLL